MIRVAIADDHDLIRRGLKSLIAQELDIKICTESATAKQLIDALKVTQPDVLLLDFSMPDASGFTLIKQIQHHWPHVPVLIFTAHNERAYGLRSIQAGAMGFITKGGDAAEVLAAIRQVASGRPYIGPAVAEQLATNALDGGTQDFQKALSNREMEVLQLLASGTTLAEIADFLNVSPKTISTHKAKILSKLDLHSTADLVRYAMANHLSNEAPSD